MLSPDRLDTGLAGLKERLISLTMRASDHSSMRLLDAGPLAVDHQVALDAALLAAVDRGESAPCWRFWEPLAPAVVIGTGGAAGREVHLDLLRAGGVPLVRRFSGGGTVLQAPGVLNYAAVFRADENDINVSASYRSVLSVIRAGLERSGLETQFEPPSDLAAGGRKLSGNAQARKRRAVLVHGTILVNLDTDLFARYLPHPPEEPAYRRGRSHAQFVTTLEREGLTTTVRELAGCLALAAGLDPDRSVEPSPAERSRAEQWVGERFGQEAWTLRK